MTQPPYGYNRSRSNVEDWLENQYEYIFPDSQSEEERASDNPYIPKDALRDHTPQNSEGSSSKGSRRHHRSSRDHRNTHHSERPMTPPDEESLQRVRDRDRQRQRSSQSYGDKTTRPRHEKDTRHPPKSERGRPRRPPLNATKTAPHTPSSSRKDKSDESRERPPHRSGRRYSLSASPPRYSGDKSRRNNSPPARSSRRSDDRDRDRNRDSNLRSHHVSSKDKDKEKPRRPSLGRSQTYDASGGKDRDKLKSIAGRSFSFLNDPRFMSAAEAALQAGATAAVGLAGTKGGWGADKSVQIARAALGAGVLNALKGPAPAPAPRASESQPTPAPAPAPVEPADKSGKVAADHAPTRRHGSRREPAGRRHHY